MAPQGTPFSAMTFSAEEFLRTLSAARAALQNAYRPYSNFSVGCGILCRSSAVYSGCNMETANYDGSHAEESALAAMVTAGRRDPMLVVCLACIAGRDVAKAGIVTSCGKCRQVIHEFGSLQGMLIWSLTSCDLDADDPTKSAMFHSDRDLLPLHFGPGDLGIDLAMHRRS